MTNFSLDTKIIYPEDKNKIENAIILLHGYGGDGNDISSLSINWKRFLKNTIFLCPNAPEKCQLNQSLNCQIQKFVYQDLVKDA